MKAILPLLMIGAFVAGRDAPATMIKLSVRLQSAEIPEDSFAAKPKVMYRAGNRYCRTEELPDPERGIHGLLILNEPDAWMVNLLTRTAQHLIDPGPTFNCHLPIFGGEQAKSTADLKNPLLELEFGQELEFFRGKGAAPRRGPTLRDKQTTVYALDIGDSKVFLFTTGTPERPWAVARQHGNVKEVFWYGAYERLPFDQKLFAKPEGVKIEDAK